MLYQHIVLTDIGDVETAIVAETYQEMAVFLAFVLDLLDHANPTSQRTAIDADCIIYLCQVIISLVDDTQSLYPICYLITVIDEPLHILIGDGGVFDDTFLTQFLHVSAKKMGT